MKKSIVVTATLSLGLLSGLASVGSTVNASSTHKGLPRTIRDSKWKSKRVYIKYRDRYETSNVHFHKSSLTGEWAGAADPFDASKLKYKYAGKHIYKLYGRAYGNAPTGGLAWHGKVKVYSSHKIRFTNYEDKTSATLYKY